VLKIDEYHANQLLFNTKMAFLLVKLCDFSGNSRSLEVPYMVNSRS